MLRSGKQQERIDVLIDMVGRAQEEGLVTPAIIITINCSGCASQIHAEAADIADFDLLLTDSLMRYVYHRYFGKVNPADLDSDWNLESTA